MKSAVIIGATGLVGGHLIRLLVKDDRYDTIRIFVRRPTGINAANLKEHVVDFNLIDEWKNQITGDELFSAMGTTIKQAGSKAAQYKVDFTFQHEVAKAAAQNGISRYLLVSASGADARSKFFYMRTKGELEREVREMAFRNIFIFRPSILTGKREPPRILEEIGAKLAAMGCRIVPFTGKYRPIEAETVAQAMIHAANIDTDRKVTVYTLDEISDVLQASSAGLYAKA